MESDRSAAHELMPLVYDELHRLAGHLLQRGGPAPTLQATALVHEAYMRLAGRSAHFENRLHFLRVAARAMRGVLVNHVRDRGRLKRGGALARVTLGAGDALVDAAPTDVLDLDAALTELARHDDELVQIVELRFFSGLTIEETAELVGVSSPTVERRWRVARAFLRRHMRDDGEGDA
ncbi:MAG: ECF-type sigma factor [Planctomycetota bacterium]